MAYSVPFLGPYASINYFEYFALLPLFWMWYSSVASKYTKMLLNVTLTDQIIMRQLSALCAIQNTQIRCPYVRQSEANSKRRQAYMYITSYIRWNDGNSNICICVCSIERFAPTHALQTHVHIKHRDAYIQLANTFNRSVATNFIVANWKILKKIFISVFSPSVSVPCDRNQCVTLSLSFCYARKKRLSSRQSIFACFHRRCETQIQCERRNRILYIIAEKNRSFFLSVIFFVVI